MAGTILEFGDFRLDCDHFELSRAGRPLKLERKPLELLILLAQREGDLVTRAEIAQHLWGSEVFVDTEHGINTAIRKVRHALRDDPDHPRFVHTVTGRGYHFVGPVTASPPPEPAPVIAQPAPFASEAPAARPFPSAVSRWLIYASIAVLFAVAVVVILRIREHPTHAATPDIRSLAVLPLDNLSGDPAQDYLAAGMTDELTTMLAKNSTLRVVSRTSAVATQYKDAHRPLRQIASDLGVDGIVEGSVARDGGNVHMTLQLIRASTDTHIWADSYDRDNNDAVSLPADAAQAIAKRLHASLAAALPPARYVSPEAHDAYLHGRYLWFSEQYGKSAEYFKKATELQPDYAPGWAGLADYYGAGVIIGDLDPRKVLRPMVAAARKAVALDNTLPQAHLTLAATYWLNDWDPARADQEALRAIQLDPEFAEAYHLRAKFLGILNRHPEAIEQQKKAMELDPFARPWGLSYIYLLARQCDAAITDGRQRLESSPGNAILHTILAHAYQCEGKDKEAAHMLARYYELTGDNDSAEALRRAFEQGGYRAVIEWQIRDLERKSATHYVSPVKLAGLYAQLGQREKAIALLEEGYRQHSPMLLDIQNDGRFDVLHADSRYRSLIRKIGLPPAW